MFPLDRGALVAWVGGAGSSTPAAAPSAGRLLQHVGRVKAAPQPWVQPQAHHLFQPAAVPLEQLGQRPTVAAERALQQDLVIARIAWHG